MTNFTESLRLDPLDGVVHANLGLTLGLLGRHAGAQEQYAEALRLDAALVEAGSRHSARCRWSHRQG